MTMQVKEKSGRPFEVRPLTQNLGAEIIGVDLARGVDD